MRNLTEVMGVNGRQGSWSLVGNKDKKQIKKYTRFQVVIRIIMKNQAVVGRE